MTRMMMAEIARRSSCSWMVASALDGYGDLGCKRTRDRVQEVRREKGNILVRKGEKGEASSHREHPNLPTAVADRRALVHAAWR
jgi:hypothetical protein